MKSILILLVTTFLGLPSSWRQTDMALTASAISEQFLIKPVEGDNPGSIRLINASSLKRLPAVVRDLSAALKESVFQEGLLLDKTGFSVYLYDVNCNRFENSAAIQYHVGDTMYHLKLNRLNQKATDEALAATLIHEIMHCVLLDILERIKNEREKFFANIIGLGLNKTADSAFSNSDFFLMMNRGDDGQHELIYQLFYTHMVSLLESFSRMHKKDSLDHRNAEFLMWSGLQNTTGYKKLSEEEKREIESTILEAKGINNIAQLQ